MPLTVINLEQIVKDWAWREYDRTATKKQAKLKEKERTKNTPYLNLALDWSEVRFRDETVWPTLAQDDLGDSNANDKPTMNGVDRSVLAERAEPHENVLFQTKFINNTTTPQEYTMRTDKSTRSTCSTTIETGYTKGVEMSVKLMTPGEIFEANAGYKREMSLMNSDGETIEEEVSWGVESQIRVKEGHVAEAKLVVDEKKYNGNFTIVSKIRGTVYVTFTNIKDNNSLVKMTGHEIDEIVKEYVERERRRGEKLEFVNFEDSALIIKTYGKCRFRYGIRQEVKVDQIPLDGRK